MVRLDKLIPFADVLEAELDGGGAAVEILHDGVADVDGVAGLDVVVVIGHIEADGGNLAVRLAFLHEVQLQVHTAGAHLAAVTGIVHIFREENRVAVAGAERLELLEDTGELGGNLREIQAGVDLHHGRAFFAGDVAGHKTVHPLAESFQVLFLQGKTGGIHVSAEVLQ